MNSEALSKALHFLNSWLAFRQRKYETPGLTVAIAHHGKLVFNNAYGVANQETGEKLTTRHIFRIASHSKTFTATAIMQIAEKGKLRIDDPIVNHLPWLKKHKDKRMQKVTARQLLSHSAGLSRDGVEADYWQLLQPFPDDAQFKKDVLKLDLVIDNNVQMKYSNYGYALLGMLIEELSGQSYAQYIQDHILTPQGLNSTGPEYTPAITKRLVTGYSRKDGAQRLPIEPTLNTRSMVAATGFYSTSEDLCKYICAHQIGSGKLLSDESKKEMQRTQWHVTNSSTREEYGLGMGIEHINGKRLVGHRGSFPGHKSISVLDTANDLVVVVMASAIDCDARWILRGIYSAIDYFQRNHFSDVIVAPSASAKPSAKTAGLSNAKKGAKVNARAANAGAVRQNEVEKFQGRYMSLWGISEIVAAGRRIISIDPTMWEPFADWEELEYVDDSTLRILKTNGYWSEKELIHFQFNKQGEVDHIRYGGIIMWPETQYLKMMSKKKRIG
ncbi:MAG TPA: serine hydrolase domain-containing protein [Candidatus Obscuribacterales bacterium]